MQNYFFNLSNQELISVFSFLPQREFFQMPGLCKKFRNLAAGSPLNGAIFRVDLPFQKQDIFPITRKEEKNSKKSSFTHFSGDMCKLLSKNITPISNLYSISEDLCFEKLPGGIVNPPILAYQIKEEKREFVGIFKRIQGAVEMAKSRLEVFDNIYKQGFQHLPQIFKSKENQLVAKVEDTCIYFMQYLIPNPSTEVSFKGFLTVTGELHKRAKNMRLLTPLKIAKLDDYVAQGGNFIDPWFQSYDSLFNDSLWGTIVHLSRVFLTDGFRGIYQNLPTQYIHGDNNQTNMVISDQKPYFIDFDSLRIDVRLLDLTSYFRYGGFKEYIRLTEEGKLFSTIQSTYGETTYLEKIYLHWMVAFSHMEFMVWAMGVLKNAVLQQDHKTTQEFLALLRLYKEQMSKVITVLKEHQNPHLVNDFLSQQKTYQKDVHPRTIYTHFEKGSKIRALLQPIVDIAKRIFNFFSFKSLVIKSKDIFHKILHLFPQNHLRPSKQILSHKTP